jgi:2-oxo-3-hexenedioate decarboxylase
VEVDQFADRLVEAVRTRTAIEPLTNEVELTVDEAYRIQDRVVERLGGRGSVIKLGLTSRAKQQQMSVDEPIYGWFTDGMGLDVGRPLEVASLIQPRVEPEVALLTGETLSGRGITSAHVLAATEAVLPAIDVLDSRYAGYRFTLADVAADNASAAGFIVGDPVPVTGIDLRLVGCVFECNGELVGTAAGAAILEHPAAAVAWFVRKLADRGEGLPAGSLVLAGALTAAIPVVAGDVVRVTVDRIGSVELTCR